MCKLCQIAPKLYQIAHVYWFYTPVMLIFCQERRQKMFVELNGRELIKYDGGGYLFNVLDMLHIFGKFVGSKWFEKGGH